MSRRPHHIHAHPTFNNAEFIGMPRSKEESLRPLFDANPSVEAAWRNGEIAIRVLPDPYLYISGDACGHKPPAVVRADLAAGQFIEGAS